MTDKRQVLLVAPRNDCFPDDDDGGHGNPALRPGVSSSHCHPAAAATAAAPASWPEAVESRGGQSNIRREGPRWAHDGQCERK